MSADLIASLIVVGLLGAWLLLGALLAPAPIPDDEKGAMPDGPDDDTEH